MSNLLHDHVRVGDRLTLSPRSATWSSTTRAPARFCQRGIGVAPMAGMLSHLVVAGSHLPITMLHADRQRGRLSAAPAVSTRCRRSARRVDVRLVRGRPARRARRRRPLPRAMDLDDVELPDDAEYYLCGPLPFMRQIRSVLLERGVRPSDVQYEVFGPDLWQADAD